MTVLFIAQKNAGRLIFPALTWIICQLTSIGTELLQNMPRKISSEFEMVEENYGVAGSSASRSRHHGV